MPQGSANPDNKLEMGAADASIILGRCLATCYPRMMRCSPDNYPKPSGVGTRLTGLGFLWQAWCGGQALRWLALTKLEG